jgi:hypothetical protein
LRWPDVPHRGRKQDEKRLAGHSNCKSEFGRTLLDAAVTKIRLTEEFFRRRRSEEENEKAGDELFAPVHPWNCKLGRIRLPSQVWPGRQVHPELHAADNADSNHAL